MRFPDLLEEDFFLTVATFGHVRTVWCVASFMVVCASFQPCQAASIRAEKEQLEARN